MPRFNWFVRVRARLCDPSPVRRPRSAVTERTPVATLEPRTMLSITPIGSEFQVNTYTTGNQQFSTDSRQTVAVDSDGDYVIVWSSAGQDGSNDGVYTQRFNAAGTPTGSELLVNARMTGQQTNPTVAMDAGGNFVVAWQSYGQDGDKEGIYAQRFDASGTKLGSEFRVNSYTSDLQNLPTIAMNADGDFVITWTGIGTGDNDLGVFAQRYSAAGTAVGGEFRVNTHTTGEQKFSAVAMDSDGDFVVTWTSFGQDGSLDGIYAQRYNAAGVAQGTEFRVNTVTADAQDRPSIALDAAGNFIIAWTGASDGNGNGIFARRFNATGTPQGSEFRANTTTVSSQRYSTVGADADGNFVIAWSSSGQDGSGEGVYAKRYSSTGVPQGSETPVNTHTSSSQWLPSIAMHASGQFLIAWRGDGSQDGNGSGIFAQRFGFGTAPTDIALSPNSVPENTAAGAVVGTLSATDVDSNESFTFSLVDGAGDSDNAGFEIIGDQLRTKTPFDFEAGPTRSVRIRVTDRGGLTFEKSLPVAITDVLELLILDDGDAGFSTTGSWKTWVQSGRGGDHRYVNPTVGSATATWAFSGLAAGQYRVSATWPGDLAQTRTDAAPFAIRESLAGPVLRQVAVNQIADPNDFSDDGSLWEDLGIVTIFGNTLVVQLANAAENDVIADAIRIERVGDAAPLPEIAVMQGTLGVNDGGTFDFGDTAVGTAVERTFTIHNVGTTNLTLQPASLPTGFSFVGANFTSGQIVAPGASTTLTVRLDGATTGSFAGTLSFATNDGDENPYNVQITGDVFPVGEVPITQILDNGAAGYSSTGPWTTYAGFGRDGDHQYLSHTAAPGTATWSFSGLTAGRYRVSATWHPERAELRSTNAPYTIRSTAGGPALGATTINQILNPGDFIANGSPWEDLGVVTIQGSTLIVELTNIGADNTVVADAIRIERIGNVLPGPELGVQLGTTPVLAGSTVDFGDTTVGTPIARTFTIHNTGTSDLVLQPATAPGGFTITTNFAANQIVAAGGTATLTVELAATSAGSAAGTLSFATSDADEPTFSITLTGDTFLSGNEPVVLVSDDGDSGFSVVDGDWQTQSGLGYGGDLRYLNQIGQNNWPTPLAATAGTVRWTFSSLPAGEYRVSATWPDVDGASTRATNAPYTIRDAVGGTVLASTTKNQATNPNDRTANGARWSDLGTVTITGSTLVVELSNNAVNGYVHADAIRIERIGPGSLIQVDTFQSTAVNTNDGGTFRFPLSDRRGRPTPIATSPLTTAAQTVTTTDIPAAPVRPTPKPRDDHPLFSFLLDPPAIEPAHRIEV